MAHSTEAKIRMYRHGLGDCFLVSLPREDDEPFRILIDCGVLLGTADQQSVMEKVVNDLADACGRILDDKGNVVRKGKLDLLAATHEHWDHLSGFLQAKSVFDDIEVEEVWMSWTEDPEDALAKSLQKQRHAMAAFLRATENRLRSVGARIGANAARLGAKANEIAGLMDFFGAAGRSTADALETVRAMGKFIVYCSPDLEALTFAGTPARFYVLGPPRSEKLIKKTTSSKKQPETYHFSALESYMEYVGSRATEDMPEAPFSAEYQMPLPYARELSFFQDRYWGPYPEANGTTSQSWRMIDGDWLECGSSLALKLDSATNNTCLALAIELLPSGKVLLFAADAQVGHWLSWQDLVWEEEDRSVTGPDLLERTVFYKVGHHGSHNATLREKGLEQMKGLQYAMIPVDEVMAKKKNWNRMPLPALVKALESSAAECVIRSDKQLNNNATPTIKATSLYYEIGISMDAPTPDS